MLNVLLIVLIVVTGLAIWNELARATLEGIYTKVFKNGRITVIDRGFVIAFWPFIVFAYAIGKSFGFFSGKK